MNPFRRRNDLRKESKSLIRKKSIGQPKSVEDTLAPLPSLPSLPQSDFRTSLILPHLTKRFTLLRDDDGQLLSLAAMENHLATQKKTGRLTAYEVDAVMAQYRLQHMYEAPKQPNFRQPWSTMNEDSSEGSHIKSFNSSPSASEHDHAAPSLANFRRGQNTLFGGRIGTNAQLKSRNVSMASSTTSSKRFRARITDDDGNRISGSSKTEIAPPSDVEDDHHTPEPKPVSTTVENEPSITVEEDTLVEEEMPLSNYQINRISRVLDDFKLELSWLRDPTMGDLAEEDVTQLDSSTSIRRPVWDTEPIDPAMHQFGGSSFNEPAFTPLFADLEEDARLPFDQNSPFAGIGASNASTPTIQSAVSSPLDPQFPFVPQHSPFPWGDRNPPTFTLPPTPLISGLSRQKSKRNANLLSSRGGDTLSSQPEMLSPPEPTLSSSLLSSRESLDPMPFEPPSSPMPPIPAIPQVTSSEVSSDSPSAASSLSRQNSRESDQSDHSSFHDDDEFGLSHQDLQGYAKVLPYSRLDPAILIDQMSLPISPEDRDLHLGDLITLQSMMVESAVRRLEEAASNKEDVLLESPISPPFDVQRLSAQLLTHRATLRSTVHSSMFQETPWEGIEETSEDSSEAPMESLQASGFAESQEGYLKHQLEGVPPENQLFIRTESFFEDTNNEELKQRPMSDNTMVTALSSPVTPDPFHTTFQHAGLDSAFSPLSEEEYAPLPVDHRIGPVAVVSPANELTDATRFDTTPGLRVGRHARYQQATQSVLIREVRTQAEEATRVLKPNVGNGGGMGRARSIRKTPISTPTLISGPVNEIPSTAVRSGAESSDVESDYRKRGMGSKFRNLLKKSSRDKALNGDEVTPFELDPPTHSNHSKTEGPTSPKPGNVAGLKRMFSRRIRKSGEPGTLVEEIESINARDLKRSPTVPIAEPVNLISNTKHETPSAVTGIASSLPSSPARPSFDNNNRAPISYDVNARRIRPYERNRVSTDQTSVPSQSGQSSSPPPISRFSDSQPSLHVLRESSSGSQSIDVGRESPDIDVLLHEVAQYPDVNGFNVSNTLKVAVSVAERENPMKIGVHQKNTSSLGFSFGGLPSNPAVYRSNPPITNSPSVCGLGATGAGKHRMASGILPSDVYSELMNTLEEKGKQTQEFLQDEDEIPTSSGKYDELLKSMSYEEPRKERTGIDSIDWNVDTDEAATSISQEPAAPVGKQEQVNKLDPSIQERIKQISPSIQTVSKSEPTSVIDVSESIARSNDTQALQNLWAPTDQSNSVNNDLPAIPRRKSSIRGPTQNLRPTQVSPIDSSPDSRTEPESPDVAHNEEARPRFTTEDGGTDEIWKIVNNLKQERYSVFDPEDHFNSRSSSPDLPEPRSGSITAASLPVFNKPRDGIVPKPVPPSHPVFNSTLRTLPPRTKSQRKGNMMHNIPIPPVPVATPRENFTANPRYPSVFLRDENRLLSLAAENNGIVLGADSGRYLVRNPMQEKEPQ